MRDKVFIDSNIWLYTLIHRIDEPTKCQLANELLHSLDAEIVVSTQVANELSNNLLRKGQKTHNWLHFFLQDFTATYTVMAQTVDDLLVASALRKKYHFSLWDSLIVASALSAECTVLYSEDMQDGLQVYGRLRITNPLKSH